VNNRKLVTADQTKLDEAMGVGVNMPTVNYSAFTASNVGRLLRGDCRYWTVVFEV